MWLEFELAYYDVSLYATSSEAVGYLIGVIFKICNLMVIHDNNNKKTTSKTHNKKQNKIKNKHEVKAP